MGIAQKTARGASLVPVGGQPSFTDVRLMTDTTGQPMNGSIYEFLPTSGLAGYIVGGYSIVFQPFRPQKETWGWTVSEASRLKPQYRDFDLDNKTDVVAVHILSDQNKSLQWNVRLSGSGTIQRTCGSSDDVPLSGDFDGDGKADMGAYGKATGDWLLSARAAQIGTPA